MPSKRIAERIASAQTILQAINARADLQAALAACGYDAARLQQGQALYDSAMGLQQQQRMEHGNLSGAQDAQEQALTEARKTYKRLREIARIALTGHPAAMQKLDLAAQLGVARADWMLQARHFYANALADQDLLAQLSMFTVTKARLQDGLRQLERAETCCASRIDQQADAKHATKQRNEVFRDLDRWMTDLQVVARRSLRDQPLYLEILKLAGTTTRRKKAKKEEKEEASPQAN